MADPHDLDTMRDLEREARIEGVVARLRERHGDCPKGITEFQCNLRRIDEYEVALVIDEWESGGPRG